jgi:DegV family protein with EDD domain
MGLGFLVLAAARAAAAGKTVDEVVAAAERMREEIQLLFVVDSLEYLHRGGRIGGAKRLFGTALSVKPILHFDNGSIEFLSQARTKRKALEQMLEIIEARLVGKRMAEAAVVDIDNPEGGQSVGELVKERFSPSVVFRAQVTIGVAFYAEE